MHSLGSMKGAQTVKVGEKRSPATLTNVQEPVASRVKLAGVAPPTVKAVPSIRISVSSSADQILMAVLARGALLPSTMVMCV